MNAKEFRDYIFDKYLFKKSNVIVVLESNGLSFAQQKENTPDGEAIVDAVHDVLISKLGYFLKLFEFFHAIAMKSSNQLDVENTGDAITSFWVI